MKTQNPGWNIGSRIGDSASIEDRLGLNTTCVIIFEHAQAELDTAGTDRLTYLGSFVALRHRP